MEYIADEKKEAVEGDEKKYEEDEEAAMEELEPEPEPDPDPEPGLESLKLKLFPVIPLVISSSRLECRLESFEFVLAWRIED